MPAAKPAAPESLPALVLDSVRHDRKAQSAGEWKPIPDWPGVSLHVRGLNYPPYKFAREQVFATLKRLHPERPATPDEMQKEEDDRHRLHGEVMAEHILLGWKGIDKPFTPALAQKLLCDPEYATLAAQVSWAASQVGFSKVEFAKETEKN